MWSIMCRIGHFRKEIYNEFLDFLYDEFIEKQILMNTFSVNNLFYSFAITHAVGYLEKETHMKLLTQVIERGLEIYSEMNAFIDTNPIHIYKALLYYKQKGLIREDMTLLKKKI